MVVKLKAPEQYGYKLHQSKQKKLILASIKLQIVAIICITVIISLLFKIQSVAIIIGGACAFIPNLYFAYYCFKYKGGANQAKKILGSIYIAEAIKFILVVCLLTINYQVNIFDPIGILTGFIGVFSSIIFLPLLSK